MRFSDLRPNNWRVNQSTCCCSSAILACCVSTSSRSCAIKDSVSALPDAVKSNTLHLVMTQRILLDQDTNLLELSRYFDFATARLRRRRMTRSKPSTKAANSVEDNAMGPPSGDPRRAY